MKTVSIKSDFLTLEISTLGAEIKSVKDTKGTEFIWNADPAVWENSAPILFPVCGALKDEAYTFDGKQYAMEGKHGFARFMEFDIKSLSDTRAVFSLKENEETLKLYPFCFELEASYELIDDTLKVQYSVTNNSHGTMYYSIGCHEGYACPEGIGEYTVVFPEKINLINHLTEGPLMNGETELYGADCKELALSPDIFEIDSLIFKDIDVHSVELRHNNSSKKITVSFPDYDVLLFWQFPGAGYICIEPWGGLPDYTDCTGELSEKVGILSVEPGNTDTSVHTIKFEG